MFRCCYDRLHHHCNDNTHKTPSIDEMVVTRVYTQKKEKTKQSGGATMPSATHYSSATSSAQLETTRCRGTSLSARVVALRTVVDHRSTTWKTSEQPAHVFTPQCKHKAPHNAFVLMHVPATATIPYWKNFNARCSHKPVQCSRTMTGETTSTIVVCFAVPFAPTPPGLEMFL